MKTPIELDWSDVYIVKAGSRLTTWSGQTLSVVVAGCSEADIPLWGNKPNDKALKAKIYYATRYDHIEGGIECLTFLTRPMAFKITKE